MTIMGNKTSEIIQGVLKNGRTRLLETEAESICVDYRMPVPPFEVGRNAKESSAAAQRVGFPVVLKVISPDILHKTDAGGVLVNIKTPAEVLEGFSRILENAKRYNPSAKVEGVLVQKMVPQGTEVIIGGLVDPQFGQALMFGLGGVFVEVLKDVTFRVAPIEEKDARQMIHEIKGYPILRGFRGSAPADEDAIIDILLKASDLMMENSKINQMDLNPVMVYDKGANIVDARIILQE